MLPNPTKKVNPQEEIPNTHPRLPSKKEEDIIILGDTQLDYSDAAIYRIGTTLEKCMQQCRYKLADFLDRANPKYFPDKSTVSRLINHENKRLPNAGQLFEMRRVFGVDLNVISDGDSPLTLDSLSDVELVCRLEQITAELSRRMRQQ